MPGLSQSNQSNSIRSRSGSTAHQEVESLRLRIVELESELHGRNVSDPRQELRLMQHESDDIDVSNVDDESDATGEDMSSQTEPTAISNAVQSDSTDPVIKDAASILEFLAWGRRKNPEYNSVISPEANTHVDGPRDVGDAQPAPSFPNDVDSASQIAFLQLLLPSKKQVWELVRYHENLLLWYHCSYHAPTFKSQVNIFYDRFGGNVESHGVNLQWMALLFAIMTGSIICAPSHQAQAWGFRPREREILSKRWLRAVYTCLEKAEYAANQSILSVQAISTLTIAVHLLGFSNMHSIHLAAVVRVAQGLGLHRISDSPGSVVEKETGRRLWAQLCSQDWFGIPFSDTYLINPLYSQSDQPMNCHDEDMQPHSDSVLTITTYCRFLTRIASIMPQLQDDLMSCNTPYTKYEQVLKWDKEMRALSTSERPVCLSNVPIDPSWPPYIHWARRSLAVSSSHKIIMIHRSFLSESFTNPAFSFTRRTCLAAARTIIKGYKSTVDDDEPTLWIHQAFSVAASIILILDVLHRSPNETEYKEHKQLAEDTVEILRQCQNSMIATRGVKLLSALFEEVEGIRPHTRKRRHDGSQAQLDWPIDAKRTAFSVPTFVKSFCNGQRSATLPTSQAIMDYRSTPDTDMSSTVADIYPLITASQDISGNFDNYASFFLPGLDSGTSFENLLYLANHDFT
jgi:hypothetical protein